ncbi:M1 family peptidase [Massilia arenosa]|uniref:Aminopeptidase n=1 Tax=Zemynaea arenosa TaxID=2561931 RepID=A0A4Y9SFA8_9BURK|nr:M1 family metallopeptidase [Massilia arenosa]TFW19878.1 M1 family peptidase [Massilia arenosa]
MHRTMISAAVLALVALSSAPTFAAPAHSAATAQATTQLPRSATPTHYDVSLTPDAAKSTFSGKVTITLNVTQATSTLTLNQLDMSFGSVTLTPVNGKGEALPGKAKVDNEAQTATFDFGRPIAPGAYKLAMDYTGLIGTQAVGLFSIDYDTPAGKKRALYTQFENSDARRMIPSWDEPNYKATFTLDVTVPASQMAISNMPATKTTTLPDGRQHVQFGRSPKMSTYLLFFGLGEFDRATAKVGSTELGVVTKKGSAPQAQFVLDASKDILKEYNDYFGVKYPLPKLDNVAAPGRSQFFGAMENWGAIFTFEYALLLDPAISTQSDKEASFSIAAHEMAHQWFGDLVTMQWWDDLWLNEGFASWMESRMSAKLHPEWKTYLSAVGVRDAAMFRDSVATTHPVVQHVQTVEQASQAFDDITYQKGESVIRMLENYVGEDAWRNGVRSYMKQYAYSNTVSDNLWQHIEKAAKKPITQIAHDFTLQPGVPMLRVTDIACKGGASQVTLEQAEFSRDQPTRKALAWHVPVVAQTLGAKAAGRTVVNGKATFSVPGCGTVVVNSGQAGYYRTLYAPAAFKQVATDFAKLQPIDQLGVLADSWALGVAGYQSASDVLDVASNVPLSAEPQVWERVAGVFRSIHGYYGADAARQKVFDAYAIERLAPVLAQIGWTARAGEADTIANLRSSLIYVLSEMNDSAVIAEARRRYAAQGTDPSAVPGPLRKTILSVVATNADAATWDQLHAAAMAEKSPLIKDNYYGMLAAAKDPALAKRALELALTDEPGVTNSASMIGVVAGRHPDMAYDFAIANMGKVNERVDSTSRSRYYPRLASGSTDPAMVTKLTSYAQANLAPTSRRDADTAVADIQYRIKVRNERLPAIDAWLAAHK